MSDEHEAHHDNMQDRKEEPHEVVSSRAARFCGSCGTPVPSGGRYCMSCGERLPSIENSEPDGVPSEAAIALADWQDRVDAGFEATELSSPPGYWQASDGNWYPPVSRTVPPQPPPPPPPPPPGSRGAWLAPARRSRFNLTPRGWLLVAMLLVPLLVFGVVQLRGQDDHTITGEMTLFDTALVSREVGAPCSGPGGFSDITQGAPVVVKSSDGKIVATGQLGAGKQKGIGGSTKISDECEFPISVTGIPTSDFYQIEVSHRGAQTYSRADLESAGWQIHLRLASP